MSVTEPVRATLAEFLAEEASGRVVELVAGEIVEKAAPTLDHGEVQVNTGAALRPFSRRGGGRGAGGAPGGWWIGTEVDVWYAQTGEAFRHDLVGFRRDRHADKPQGLPVRARPDWVGEVLSPSTASRDHVKKLRTLHRHGVPHFWILDPEHQTLLDYRFGTAAYAVALTAGTDEIVRAEPFDAIEIDVGALFGVERA